MAALVESSFQSDIEALRAKQDALLLSSSSDRNASSLSSNKQLERRLNGLAKKANLSVEQWATDIAALRSQKTLPHYPAATMTAEDGVALAAAGSFFALLLLANADLSDVLAQSQDWATGLVAQFRAQNTDLYSMVEQRIRSLDPSSFKENLLGQSPSSSLPLETAVPLLPTDGGSSVLEQLPESLPPTQDTVLEQMPAALPTNSAVRSMQSHYDSLRESLRLQYAVTEDHVRAQCSVWNQEMRAVVSPMAELVREQFRLLPIRIDASNQEFLEKAQVVVENARQQVAECQQVANAKMPAAYRALIKEVELWRQEAVSKLCSMEVLGLREFLRLEVLQLFSIVQELGEVAVSLRSEVHRMQQELLSKTLPSTVEGFQTLIDSVRAEANQLKQDFASLDIDWGREIKGRIGAVTTSPPISLNFPSNVRFPDVVSVAVEGMKESIQHVQQSVDAQGFWKSTQARFAQTQLPTLPNADLSGFFKGAISRMPSVDLSGLRGDAVPGPIERICSSIPNGDSFGQEVLERIPTVVKVPSSLEQAGRLCRI